MTYFNLKKGPFPEDNILPNSGFIFFVRSSPIGSVVDEFIVKNSLMYANLIIDVDDDEKFNAIIQDEKLVDYSTNFL